MTDEAYMSIFVRGSGRTATPAERINASAAFEELYRRYKQPVYGFFCRRTRDTARADELTQEYFLAVLQSAQHYRPTASFRTFLYAIGLALKCPGCEIVTSHTLSTPRGEGRVTSVTKVLQALPRHPASVVIAPDDIEPISAHEATPNP